MWFLPVYSHNVLIAHFVLGCQPRELNENPARGLRNVAYSQVRASTIRWHASFPFPSPNPSQSQSQTDSPSDMMFVDVYGWHVRCMFFRASLLFLSPRIKISDNCERFSLRIPVAPSQTPWQSIMRNVRWSWAECFCFVFYISEIYVCIYTDQMQDTARQNPAKVLLMARISLGRIWGYFWWLFGHWWRSGWHLMATADWAVCLTLVGRALFIHRIAQIGFYK